MAATSPGSEREALGNFPYLFRVVVTQSPSVTKATTSQLWREGKITIGELPK
jgi:hypothetical protein